MSHSDIDTICLPFLRYLYQSPLENPIRVYPVLLIFLLLSEDDSFNTMIHSRIRIPNVEWYLEENISDIYLGSLIIIIILRVISQNSKHHKDQYIYHNCYAILFNTASYVDNIHLYYIII